MREATAFGSKTPHLGLLSAGVLIMIILLFTRFFPNRNQTSVQAGDGAEFAAHYLCRFSGIEITIESVRKLISSKDRSLNHLVSALKQLEVRTEIRRLSIDDIDSDSLPAAIEMQNPKHFIVVTGRNDQTFFLFGPDGARRSTQVENLREHWTGNCLTLTNYESVKKIRVGARADFETLIMTKGLYLHRAVRWNMSFLL